MAEPQDQAIRDLTRMSPALGRPAMPKTEAFLSAQRPEIPGYISEQDVAPVMQELRGEEAAARTRAGEAEVNIEAAKRAEKGREAQMKGELVQRQARETAALPERQQLMAKRQEFANAAFAPTRDNAEDLAKLFSLIGVLGVAIGGRGRGAGLQAMTAMNGMLEGYRRGRGDLYKQQLGEFDRSLKAMQQQVATLEKQYAEAVKLKALDREAGELEIQRVLAESDSPVLKAMRDRQGDLAALSYVQNMAKDVATAATLRNSLQTAADQRQARLDAQKAQQEFQTRERLAREQFQARQSATEAARRNLQVVQTPQGPRVIDISTLQRATPEELAGATPFRGAGAQGRVGQNALTFASRVYGNIENASQDLSNIVALPAVSQAPVFAGIIGSDPTTALGSMKALAARKITSAEQKGFEQITNSLDAALSRLEAQGLASGATKASVQSFNALKPKAGDPAINMALYLARVKQEIQTGIKVHDKMPGATAEQKAATKAIIDNIDKVVPYDVGDVLGVLGRGRSTIDQKMQKLLAVPAVTQGYAPEVTGSGELAAQPPKSRTQGPQEGDRTVSKSGKPIVYRNGKWEYE